MRIEHADVRQRLGRRCRLRRRGAPGLRDDDRLRLVRGHCRRNRHRCGSEHGDDERSSVHGSLLPASAQARPVNVRAAGPMLPRRRFPQRAGIAQARGVPPPTAHGNLRRRKLNRSDGLGGFAQVDDPHAPKSSRTAPASADRFVRELSSREVWRPPAPSRAAVCPVVVEPVPARDPQSVDGSYTSARPAAGGKRSVPEIRWLAHGHRPCFHSAS